MIYIRGIIEDYRCFFGIKRRNKICIFYLKWLFFSYIIDCIGIFVSRKENILLINFIWYKDDEKVKFCKVIVNEID